MINLSFCNVRSREEEQLPLKEVAFTANPCKVHKRRAIISAGICNRLKGSIDYVVCPGNNIRRVGFFSRPVLLCGAEKDRTAEETNPPDVIAWANNIIDAALQSVADACRDDGPALVDLACRKSVVEGTG